MMRLRFVRDFDWHELIARKNCVICKVMGVRVFKASDKPVVVSREVADAALKAGAAIEVTQ